jgi:chemotaxis signal transduction protein
LNVEDDAMAFTPLPESSQAASGELRYGFCVAGLHLVPAARVLTEMIAEARVFPVPKSSPALAGVTNLRGTVVPLLDRREVRRGAPSIRPFMQRALVFDHDDHRIGLLLDAQPELLTLMPAPPDTPKPESVLSAFLTRAWIQFDQPDRIWWEFNHRAAFESLARHASHVNATPAESADMGIEEVIA